SLLLFFLLSVLFINCTDATITQFKRPLMRRINTLYPEPTVESTPFDQTTIEVECAASWVANWCLNCHNIYCKKHCEDCGLEWGTMTTRCYQYGYRPADVLHTCLLLEAKATERMMGDKTGSTWESMAAECRKCEARIHEYSHEVNLDLINYRPDPIPEFS
ncbi:hypothetical protein PFISCL1PPCAC_4105, partial [Pristionchus fissidentatus]